MTIAYEVSLRHFNFWDGAILVASRLTVDELDSVEKYLEEISEGRDEPLSDTEINDFFRFETDTILEWLDINEDEFWERDMRWG